MAIKFANDSLQTVAGDRISDFPGYGNTKAASVKAIVLIRNDKVMVADALALSGQRDKLAPLE